MPESQAWAESEHRHGAWCPEKCLVCFWDAGLTTVVEQWLFLQLEVEECSHFPYLTQVFALAQHRGSHTGIGL